jgi:hypothetical protein
MKRALVGLIAALALATAGCDLNPQPLPPQGSGSLAEDASGGPGIGSPSDGAVQQPPSHEGGLLADAAPGSNEDAAEDAPGPADGGDGGDGALQDASADAQDAADGD